VEKKQKLHLIIGENIIARIVIEKPEKPLNKLARNLVFNVFIYKIRNSGN
jgi:hypothetical protein